MLINISIWLIEDEMPIAEALEYSLTREGASVRIFSQAQCLIEALAIEAPQLIIADVGLPDMDGFALFRIIKAKLPDLPWIFLTARSEEIDRVLGLELGADDYIAKPFSLREVNARVRTLLRRTTLQASVAAQTQYPVYQYAVFSLNENTADIYYHQQRLHLTRTEYLLLKTLLHSPQRVFSRSQLMDAIWHDEHDSMERTVDTHIKTLRAKLNVINSHDEPIRTHRGLGYSLQCH